MVVIRILLLAASAALTVWVLTVLFRVLRGADKRRLLAEARSTLCDAPDGIGISVLYSFGGDFSGVASLLDVGYSRYEAVVTIDAERYPEAFGELVSKYCLIQVNHTLAAELPVQGVRGLYRSRKRCFRRLVAVNKEFTSVASDFDAAAAAATYEYVLPLGADRRLMPYAIGRLAAELSGHQPGEKVLVRSMMGAPALLINRELVVKAGGFLHRPWRGVPRRCRATLYEPLLRSVREPLCAGRRWRWRWRALLLASAVFASAAAGWWTACAVLLTVTVAWCSVWLAASLADEGTEYVADGPAVVAFLLRRFSVKNFTMS